MKYFPFLKPAFSTMTACALAIMAGTGCTTTDYSEGDAPVGPVYGVLLDPGHGGDPEDAAARSGERFKGLGKYAQQGYREECYGAISADGCMEKAATLAVAKKVKGLLEARGIPVAMTRSTDTYTPLNERVAKSLAPEYRNWIMVSIHFNRSSSKQKATNLQAKYKTPRGFEIYVLPGRGQRSTMGSRGGGFLTVNNTRSGNMLLARSIEAQMSEIPGMRNRGIKTAWFQVLRGSPMPSVLVEGGFMSNPEEGRLIASDDYQGKLARAIVGGIYDYSSRSSMVAQVSTKPKTRLAASQREEKDFLLTSQ